MRVLKWIIDRCHGRAYAKETTLGWMPARRTSTWKASTSTIERPSKQMQRSNLAEFKAEILSQEELFLKLAGDLPKEMVFQRELLISREMIISRAALDIGRVGNPHSHKVITARAFDQQLPDPRPFK
jgi:GTP-dependent phosphoenolpyruvate carboxykinase